MRLSINKRLINKNELNDKGAFSAGFQSVDVSASELAASINKGYAYSSQFSKGRKAENFVCSDIISADFDGTRTIEDALGDDFVKRYATLFYTTPSHTEADNRFRIVFELPRTIVDAKEYARAATGLSRRLNSDPAATDAARVFYGSRQSNPILLGNRLDEATLEHLITLGESPRNLSDSIGTAGKAVTRANVPLSPDAVVRTAKGENVAVKSLPPATSIFCPFHSDRSPSAFTTRSRFDDVGIHCSTCQSTFWVVPPVRDYDFFYFDKITRRLYEDEMLSTLVEFVKYCEKNKPKIEQVLGIDIRKDIRTKPMTQLQAFLSKVGMKTVGVGEVRTGGKKTYQYGIDPKRLEERLEIVHARALTSDDSPQ